MADTPLDALGFSVARLHDLATSLRHENLSRPAYPSAWSIADVLSHLGSAAVILQRRLDDALTGHTTPDAFAPGVWDVWDAKTPQAKRDDALATDSDLLDRFVSTTAAERARFELAMGPITVGFDQLVALRLNEHAFHTWDIDVALNPDATIPHRLVDLVVDNLELTARYTAKPTGAPASITVATTDPARGFTVDLAESVTFAATPATPAAADVELPAEAFARLVYGRLDPEHTPPGDHGPGLDLLRPVFPGP